MEKRRAWAASSLLQHTQPARQAANDLKRHVIASTRDLGAVFGMGPSLLTITDGHPRLHVYRLLAPEYTRNVTNDAGEGDEVS